MNASQLRGTAHIFKGDYYVRQRTYCPASNRCFKRCKFVSNAAYGEIYCARERITQS
nr:MAG TPA: hypothetical protein [Bacteriophage sp.]